MDFVINAGSEGFCIAGGQLKGFQTLNPRVMPVRVLVDGKPIMTQDDMCPVVGCPVQVPCAFFNRWVNVARRLKVGGKEVLLQSTMGDSAIPSGHKTAQLIAKQTRVRGT